jgi:hypothetical protein
VGFRPESHALGRRGGAAVDDPAGDLDLVIQQIFTAGVLLGHALGRRGGCAAAVADAVGRLDEAVITIRSALPRGDAAAEDLETLAARLDRVQHDVCHLTATSAAEATPSLREAAFSIHRAQVAVSEACALPGR